MIKSFDNDHWGVTDIFKAADKRIGKRRLEKLREQSNSEAVHKIIEIRLNLKVT